MSTIRRSRLIRVLVADDSQVTQELMRAIVDAEPDMIVVGTAVTGRDAVRQVERLRPDLVTMDVVMPDGDGITSTKQIMAQRPTPIAVVTTALADPIANVAFEALAAGAVDVFTKPHRRMLDDDAERSAFARKLRYVAEVGVVGIRGANQLPVRGSDHSSRPPDADAAPRRGMPATAALIAVGASTGGPPCIRTVLGSLDPTGSPPVVLVQHMGREFIPGFASWLQSTLPLPVEVAASGTVARPGRVYVAPGDLHLKIDANRTLFTDASAPRRHQRPSVDVLFHAVAECFGPRAIGVLLTGMGDDGADGLAAMRAAGSVTIAQDEESSVVFGMPKAAIERDAASLTGNPVGISWLLRHVKATPSSTPHAGVGR